MTHDDYVAALHAEIEALTRALAAADETIESQALEIGGLKSQLRILEKAAR